MFHTLCATCIHTCKQDESAKIMQCPKYLKRMSDSEFNAMLDELKDLETQAEGIRERAQNLIRETLDVDVPVDDGPDDDRSDDDGDSDDKELVEDGPETDTPEAESPDA